METVLGFLDFIRREWPVIRRAPVLTFGILSIGLAAGWFAHGWLNPPTIAAPQYVRSPTKIYQGGWPVADVRNPRISAAHGLLGFDAVVSDGALDFSKRFEYSDMNLVCEGKAGGSVSIYGIDRINYDFFLCRIMGSK